MSRTVKILLALTVATLFNGVNCLTNLARFW